MNELSSTQAESSSSALLRPVSALLSALLPPVFLVLTSTHASPYPHKHRWTR